MASNIESVSTMTEGKKSKISESLITKIVAEATRKVLNEAKKSAIDLSTFFNFLEDNNWNIVQETEVRDSKGNAGIRFRIEPKMNAVSFESLVSQIKRASSNPNGVIGSIGRNRYAPEMQSYSIVVIGA